MNRQAINTDAAPRPVGPYSQSVAARGLLFIAGQMGIDPKKGALVDGGIEAQTRQALDNLMAINLAAGATMADILKTTIFLLDFDDFVVGPAVHDVWMLLPGRDAEALRQREILIDAYRQFRDFDARWLRLVEPLRAFRFVWYPAWIARRWEDPAFPAAFPHFGTAQYWESETRDLEEQLRRLAREADAPEGLRPAADPEPELTNADLFWDL